MSKKTDDQVREQVVKQPRRIAVATMVPWFIIAVTFAGIAGFIGGYFTHINMLGEAKQQAASVVVEVAGAVDDQLKASK